MHFLPTEEHLTTGSMAAAKMPIKGKLMQGLRGDLVEVLEHLA